MQICQFMIFIDATRSSSTLETDQHNRESNPTIMGLCNEVGQSEATQVPALCRDRISRATIGRSADSHSSGLMAFIARTELAVLPTSIWEREMHQRTQSHE